MLYVCTAKSLLARLYIAVYTMVAFFASLHFCDTRFVLSCIFKQAIACDLQVIVILIHYSSTRNRQALELIKTLGPVSHRPLAWIFCDRQLFVFAHTNDRK